MAAGEEDSGTSPYECNICLDTASEPVVTYCGHLYCWPCLYRWLRAATGPGTCPVCKAAVSPQTVIPLYGRGSDRTDPRRRGWDTPGGGAGGAVGSSTAGGGGGGGGGGGSEGGSRGAASGATGVAGGGGGEAGGGGGGAEDAVPNRPAGQRVDLPREDRGARVGGGWGGGGEGGGGGPGSVAYNAGIGFFPSLFGLQFQTFGLDAARPRGQPLTREEEHQVFLSRMMLFLGIAVLATLLFL